MKKMKINVDTVTLAIMSAISFILSYFYNILLTDIEQFIAVTFIILLDGYFGIKAGIKKEGFKTKKALKIPKTLAFWCIILGALLTVEKGFPGLSWISETVIIPCLLFEIVSILKNAADAGFIKRESATNILRTIDQHKNIGPKE